MKKKLKIALLFGGIIGNTYGAAQNISNENESPGAAACVSSTKTNRCPLREREITLNTANRIQRFEDRLSRRILKAKTQTLANTVVLQQKQAAGYAEMIDSPYGKVLEKPLNLTANYQSALKLSRDALAEAEVCTAQLRELKENTLKLEKDIEISRFNDRLLVNKLKLRSILSETKNTFSITSATSGRPYKHRTTKNLIKEAQQNCLGTVTWVYFDAADGSKQTVEMYPSTTYNDPYYPDPSTANDDESVSWEGDLTEEASEEASGARKSPIFDESVSLEDGFVTKETSEGRKSPIFDESFSWESI